MSKLSLKSLQAFVAVADTGSFGAAAILLNTTQPNISNRLATLETQLGLSLFARGIGKTSLTAKGRELLPLARDTLKQSDAFLLAADAPEVLNGVLRLGVSEVVAHSWLRSFMQAFALELPSVRVELTVDLSRQLLDRMQAGELDLCFQTESRPLPGLGFIELDRHDFTWVVAADTPPAVQRLPLIKALAQSSLFLPAKGTQPYIEFETFTRRFDVEAGGLVPSSNLSVALSLVRDGLGLGLLPWCMVEADVAVGRLVTLEHDWVPEPLLSSARFSEARRPIAVEQALETAQSVAS
ncbi:MAG: LysR family transcriptional regulator [Geminicoccus sp.]|nr:LysR family transcriptional regulator [Geminicoccus sp.]